MTDLHEEEKAMQYALRVLGYRARSIQEMRRKLETRKFPEDITAHVLHELLRLQLLDDREFAQSWISSRRSYGAVRLRRELYQKGICREVVEDTITTGVSADEEYQAAWDVAVRSLRGAIDSTDRDVQLRIRRLLQRRGFSYDTVNRVCARLNNNSSAEDWLE
ncbi:MAG: RecX family transcriptional regulator [bacterium]